MPDYDVLHESSEPRGPMFQGGRMYSLLDILGGGVIVCDMCGKWQRFAVLGPSFVKEEMEKKGWAVQTEGKDICPVCVKANANV